MKAPAKILETSLYARDLNAMTSFYTDIMGFTLFAHEKDRHVFFKCADAMLLIFNPDATQRVGSGLPPHGAHGQGHVAFSVDGPELAAWQEHLEKNGIPIEADLEWPRDGRSIYFRDPAGNSIELAMPSIWGFESPGDAPAG